MSKDSIEVPEEINPWPLGGYAPGNYSCRCRTCKNEFRGDMWALQCLECAAKTTHAYVSSLQSQILDYRKALEEVRKEMAPRYAKVHGINFVEMHRLVSNVLDKYPSHG